MDENTPYFLIFPFFETLEGQFPPCRPNPHGVTPISCYILYNWTVVKAGIYPGVYI